MSPLARLSADCRGSVVGSTAFVSSAAYVIVSPIYYIMLIESIQSISASDGNLLDGIRDTLIRFIPYSSSASSSIGAGRMRMLPIWKILVPAIGLLTGRYMCEKILYKIILPTLNAIQEADQYRKRKQRSLAHVTRRARRVRWRSTAVSSSCPWTMISRPRRTSFSSRRPTHR
jgi:hypothetical protein